MEKRMGEGVDEWVEYELKRIYYRFSQHRCELASISTSRRR